MATNTRKLSDFLAEGSGDTFGDLPVENPHIKPGTLYPAWSGLLTDNTAYTFTDSSASARTITVVGDVHHTGRQKQVGNTTLNFNGGHLNMPDSADWDMAGGEFTIEYWVRGDVTSNKMHIGQNSSAGIVRSLVEAQSGTPKIVAYYYGSSAQALISTTTFAANTWYHVAIVRNNSGTDAVNLFINGTQEATIAPNANTANDGTVLSIGAFGTYVAQNHLGYMDEIRIIKGTCAYTGNFTPPTALTTTGGTYSSATNVNTSITASHTKLLLHSEAGGHVGAYGTAQSDGYSYYYTDIKGSKPIKDPRIGSHFGSQRHRFSSLQLLEQETATHGKNVYSFDGRGWARGVAGNNDWRVENAAHGVLMSVDSDATGAFFEITGYFNDINFHQPTDTDRGHDIDLIVNGVESINSATIDDTTVGSPLYSRFVTSSSLINVGSVLSASLGTTPKINTLKYLVGSSGQYVRLSGIELIAQDTTSTANKSKIQIPAQNVVSYGKKFAIPATAQHYDPFNGFTNGSSVTAYVDTATSLGVEGWKNSSTYYRPYNGGRVVKWVDSSGTIKTSVNVMPPNAKSMKNADISKKANASVANDTYLPTFESGAIDHSLAEVAKTFHYAEFGNGSANGGTGATYADASMLSATADDIAYVMDDGLTSLSGDDVWTRNGMLQHSANGDVIYITFIGTGISFAGYADGTGDDEYDKWIDGVQIVDGDISRTSGVYFTDNLAQNLPYGTHILKIERTAVNVYSEHYKEFTFHQPKMPPIPEDCVVLADYMLMSDYVKATAGGEEEISKGLRLISTSRDCFHNTSGTFQSNQVIPSSDNVPFGLAGTHTTDNPSAGGTQCKLPAFGTHLEIRSHANKGDIFVDGSDVAGTSSGSGYFGLITQDTASTLGSHVFESKNGTANNHNISAMGIVTPIHTSSHYQSFETPFLHELTGGDRNMEQNNLIVTPDGKSWDEVTRDTSYLGNMVVSTSTDTTNTSHDTINIFDEWRGTRNTYKNSFNKDFAIAYNGLICLVEGEYKIQAQTIRTATTTTHEIKINGTAIHRSHGSDNNHDTPSTSINIYLKRGDLIQHAGCWYHHLQYSNYQIERV